MLFNHHQTINYVQRAVDVFLSAFFWWLAYFVRFKVLENAEQNLESLFVKLTFLICISTLYSFNTSGLYYSQRFTSRFKEIMTTFKANLIAIIVFVILIYFFADGRVSRLAIGIYFVISTLGFIVSRLMIRNTLRALRKKGRNLRHVLLVGNSKQLSNYIHTVYTYKDSGVRFLGWIDSDDKCDEFNNIKKINDSYKNFRKNNEPQIIILSYQGKDSYKANEFIKNNYNDIVPIQLLPDLSYSMIGHQIEDFGGIPLVSVNHPSFSSIELFFKKFIELLGTVIGLLVISPLMIVISIAVKLSSPGPIFFGQERVGLNGKKFKMWKFRSMMVSTERDPVAEWSNKDNPRKTRVGDFLRKTSLDELPQLWNVVIGNMSLVGPRPEQPHFVEQFRHKIPGYMLKHKMKPGITGWAQINGWRGDSDLTKRIECDIYYIKNWSIWLDCKIIFLTFWKGFIHKNAY